MELFNGKTGRPENENGGAVPVGRKGIREVKFAIGNGMRPEGLVAFPIGAGWRSEAGKVTPVGNGRVLFVPLSSGRGRRPGPVMFKNGRGGRPDTDALKLVVKFIVGSGKKPELGRPEIGRVGYPVPLALGKMPAETDNGGRVGYPVVGYSVPLTLGKMPVETVKVGIVLMFKVGKGRLEKGKFVLFFEIVMVPMDS